MTNYDLRTFDDTARITAEKSYKAFTCSRAFRALSQGLLPRFFSCLEEQMSPQEYEQFCTLLPQDLSAISRCLLQKPEALTREGFPEYGHIILDIDDMVELGILEKRDDGRLYFSRIGHGTDKENEHAQSLHRVMFLFAFGRWPRQGEDAHHVDCDRNNNDPENFWGWIRDEHGDWHRRTGRYTP